MLGNRRSTHKAFKWRVPLKESVGFAALGLRSEHQARGRDLEVISIRTVTEVVSEKKRAFCPGMAMWAETRNLSEEPGDRWRNRNPTSPGVGQRLRDVHQLSGSVVFSNNRNSHLLSINYMSGTLCINYLS